MMNEIHFLYPKTLMVGCRLMTSFLQQVLDKLIAYAKNDSVVTNCEKIAQIALLKPINQGKAIIHLLDSQGDIFGALYALHLPRPNSLSLFWLKIPKTVETWYF
eukprot:gb/GEZN01010182.1/.p2 GENE.gb/GEZN01010182.1/~~gb/GEZN01010182.1/.p2  ORF type:complete len:104 (-),score=1.76 gb/GEZN01010182.1/:879-1190(-)